MSLREDIYAMLDAATKENDYPHDYQRAALDEVLEMHDWSGLEGFDPDNIADQEAAAQIVTDWRRDNPEPVTTVGGADVPG